jgi:hypothetical protein
MRRFAASQRRHQSFTGWLSRIAHLVGRIVSEVAAITKSRTSTFPHLVHADVAELPIRRSHASLSGATVSRESWFTVTLRRIAETLDFALIWSGEAAIHGACFHAGRPVIPSRWSRPSSGRRDMFLGFEKVEPPNQCAAANPAWRRGLQFTRPECRVAELGGSATNEGVTDSTT